MFAGTYLLSGGSKKQAQQGPPINAGSKEEGDFIQYVSPWDARWEFCSGLRADREALAILGLTLVVGNS